MIGLLTSLASRIVHFQTIGEFNLVSSAIMSLLFRPSHCIFYLYSMADITELVINCVRERPCLFDPANINYKRADIKMNNWLEIASCLESDGEYLNLFAFILLYSRSLTPVVCTAVLSPFHNSKLFFSCSAKSEEGMEECTRHLPQTQVRIPAEKPVRVCCSTRANMEVVALYAVAGSFSV